MSILKTTSLSFSGDIEENKEKLINKLIDEINDSNGFVVIDCKIVREVKIEKQNEIIEC